MDVIKIGYEPSEKQKEFHASTADETLYGGAAGGGKSCAVVMDALAYCLKYPGFRAYLFRRTYKELEDTLIVEAQKFIPPSLGKYSATSHEMKFPNGSTMYFRYCQNEQDKYNYQGAEIYGLYIDELTNFPKSIFDFLMTRVRAPISMGVHSFAKFTTNPGGIGHGWVKQRFIDPMPTGGIVEREVLLSDLGITVKKTYEFIPAKLSDNPHLGIDYRVNLESQPKALREALLNGNWDAFEGQVFLEWQDRPEHYIDGENTHVIEPFPIPDHWPRYCGYDHGYSKPFAVLWVAVGPNGRMYVYREWYGWNGEVNTGLRLEPTQIAAGILEREADEKKRGIRFYRVGDPSIWSTQTGESTGDMMSARGVFFESADNNRISGKMQLHYRLRMQDDNKPLLQVFSTCKQFIRTLPGLNYSLTKPEDVDTQDEDHDYDAIRYVAMERPIAAKTILKSKPKEFDPFSRRKHDS